MHLNEDDSICSNDLPTITISVTTKLWKYSSDDKSKKMLYWYRMN